MTFNDQLKYSLTVYSSIHRNRAAVLNQLFCVNGNGMDWYKGQLVGSNEGTTAINELVQIEQYIGAGLHLKPREDAEYIPARILDRITDYKIPKNIETRLSEVANERWYPMSDEYNKLLNLPDDIQPDWLNAAWECATLIADAPVSTISWGDNTPEQAAKEQKANAKIARKALAQMTKQFPNFTFERNPIPTFDEKRKYVKGVMPWPIDGSPVNEWKFDFVGQFIKALRFAYSMKRKNEGKNIPYYGLDLGHDSRAGCFGPESRFHAKNLEYDKTEQGRNALEVIMGTFAQVCIEQGKRLAYKALKETLNSYFMMDKFEKERMLARIAEKDPVKLAKYEIQDRLKAREGDLFSFKEDDEDEDEDKDAPKKAEKDADGNWIVPLIDNESDPIQKQALDEVIKDRQLAHERMTKMLEGWKTRK